MAAFVLALLIGGSWDTNAAEAAVEVRIVDLGGYCVRVQSAGLDARTPGTPLVIFESGVAQSSDAWRSILSRAGRFVPALSYDRAGLGESEWDRADPTIEQMNFRLRRLLDQLGAEPPYILVGHSLGGMLVHQFAARWPSEVSGLVLVDPAPLLTEARSFGLLPFEKIGAGEKAFDLYWSAVSEMVSKASPPVQAEFQMLRETLEAELEERAIVELPPLPLVVVVAAKYQALPLYDSMPFDGREYFDAELRLRVGVLQDWVISSPDGTLVVTNSVAHSIPRDAPDLVLWAIERLVKATSTASFVSRMVWVPSRLAQAPSSFALAWSVTLRGRQETTSDAVIRIALPSPPPAELTKLGHALPPRQRTHAIVPYTAAGPTQSVPTRATRAPG